MLLSPVTLQEYFGTLSKINNKQLNYLPFLVLNPQLIPPFGVIIEQINKIHNENYENKKTLRK